MNYPLEGCRTTTSSGIFELNKNFWVSGSVFMIDPIGPFSPTAYSFRNTPNSQVGASSMLWAWVNLVILAVIPALGVT